MSSLVDQQRKEREQALHERGAADSTGPSDRKVRVFVSYSRTDKEFAEGLVVKLAARGFEPFLDTKQILPGEAWRERLSALILSADVVVFLISPDSVLPTSVCDWELNETERLGKRLLPVVCRKTPDETVPSRLRRLNWIDMTDANQAGSRLDALASAILTDIGWIREHTRFGELADRWASKASREEHSLLRGKDVDEAELWISSQPREAPEVTELQRTFIVESRRAEQRRAGEEREQLARTRRFQKRSAWALAAIAVLMVAGAVATAWQFHATSLRESNVLASIAAKAFQDGYCDRALRYAVAGLPPRGSTPLVARNEELELALTRYASACRLEFAVSSPEIMLKNRSIGKAGQLDRLIHETRPMGAVFSADGSLVATFLGDDAIRIVNVADRREVSVIKQANVADIVLSPDARTLFTRAQDNAVRVLDVATGHERAAFRIAGKRVSAMAVSPDGRLVAMAGDDFVTRLWDVAAVHEISTLPGHTKEVRKLAFSADGRMLLSLSAEGTAPRLWDVQSGGLVSELVGHGDTVRDGAFSPDGTRVATTSEDTTARIWDAHSGSLIHTLRRHAGIVGHAVFSPDGLRVATGALDAVAGARDSSVRVWDVRDGSHLLLLSGHAGSIAAIAFSPDGKRILTASYDRTARLWNAETGAELVVYKGHVGEIRDAAMAPDGKHFATASLDGTTRFWSADLDRGSVTVEGTLLRPAEASFSPDGSKLVTVGPDNAAAVWDGRTGERLVPLQDHAKAIVSTAFSRDGLRLATGSQDGVARVFDASSGALISALPGHTAPIKSVAFRPDGQQVLTVSEDETARLWDVASGSQIKILRQRNDEKVAQAVFVPGTGEIMTAAYHEGVKVWTPTAEQVSHRLEHPNPNSNPLLRERAVEAIVSPDGRTTIVDWSNMTSTFVIYEGRQAVRRFSTGIGMVKPVFRFEGKGLKAIIRSLLANTARIVDLTTGEDVATLRGHTNAMTGAAFSPDGRRIVTDSRDHTIRIWDANTGAEIGLLPDDRERGPSPIFAPGGTRLVIQHPEAQRTVLLNLDPVNFVPAGARRDYICRERLDGAETFSDQEMEDPVLRSRDDLRNPCRAFGPFAIEYYSQMLGLSRR